MHATVATELEVSLGAVPERSASVRELHEAADDQGRAALMVQNHFAFVWRLMRRFGLSEADADDAAQQVFIVASRRVASIKVGSEQAFLFGTAMRVAARARRTQARRHDTEGLQSEGALASSPGPDELVEQRQARALLDRILSELSNDLRAVFVLYEIEQMTMIEIARLLAVPQGTVASRLRRARAHFEELLTEYRQAGGTNG
jgi:RNA polymerase sigma-70 factor (ECF subfamily)